MQKRQLLCFKSYNFNWWEGCIETKRNIQCDRGVGFQLSIYPISLSDSTRALLKMSMRRLFNALLLILLQIRYEGVKMNMKDIILNQSFICWFVYHQIVFVYLGCFDLVFYFPGTVYVCRSVGPWDLKHWCCRNTFLK